MTYRSLSALGFLFACLACSGEDSGGGSNTGGSNTGGSNTGGSNTGGSNTGGSNTGGSNTGGSNTGGASTGGASGSGSGGLAGSSGEGGSAGSSAGGTSGSGGSGGGSGGALGTSALATAAGQLASGQMAPFSMGGLDDDLVSANGTSVPSLLTFAARGVWDATHKKIQFAGTSHTGGQVIAGAGGLITWDDASNQWSKESYSWSSEAPGHAYYHVTVDPNGHLYFRSPNSPQILRRLYGSAGQSSWQNGKVTNHPNEANQFAGGLEWFPELNSGAGGLVFADSLGAAWSNAGLTSWSQQAGDSVSGNYHNWIAHADGYVYFGGGNGSKKMYRLSPSGSVSPMPDTPFEAGMNGNDSIILADPATDGLLSFQMGSTGAVHRFNGSAWTSAGSHSIGGTTVIGCPVPDYDVIVFVVHPNGTGTPYAKLYKP